ncbi:MAG: TonB family protein [Porphyromonadaceae bacterium]|nr:TonB family protein [Porphyromonadaceae bacterium]
MELQTVETSVTIETPTFEMLVDEPERAVTLSNIPWKQILILLYIGVTFFFVFRFFWQLISILRIRLKSEKTTVSDIGVYNLKDDITPFSFFGMIFINSDMHSEEELAQIIIHEHTHAREKHSLDMILIEIILLFSWWNPIVWLLKHEMAMNLEYLADHGVLREGVDSKDYQYHLLRLTYHETAVQIVNNFNVSQLKQRIMMMNKTRSSTLKLAKYLLILPLVFLLVTANSLYAAQPETVSDETVSKPAIVFGEEIFSPTLYTNKDLNIQDPPPVRKQEGEEEIFVVVEKMPEFPGGQKGMMQFLADSIRYPKEAMEKGIQGRVICNFVVMKDGSVSDVQIVRGVDPLIDAEAVRVLKLMPDWKPGTQHGKDVNVRFTLPVVFSLVKKESKIVIDEPKQVNETMSVEAQVQPNFTFPGGQKEMMRFISGKIRYPVEAQEKGLQGLVNTSFRVNGDGTITGAEVTDGAEGMSTLNNEVLRIIKEMPRWEKDEFVLVSGRVTDSNSQPLQGAAVIIKGTNSGTITNASGGFQLKVPASESSIVISFVGYKTEVVSVSTLKPSGGEIVTNLPVVFRLQGDDTSKSYSGPAPENAVVVVGYGTKKSNGENNRAKSIPALVGSKVL